MASWPTTPELGRWEALAAARTRARSAKGSPRSWHCSAMPDVISFAGGFPDPETFPRERVATLLAEFAASGEASAFQYAPTQGLAGARTRSRSGSRRCRAAPRGRRAADHERRDRGARARREVVPRRGRHRRRRRADVSRRDPVVPQLRGRARRRAARRATGSTSTSSSGGSRGASAEAPLHDSRSSEPGRRQPRGRAARGARRARPPHGFLIVEDVAYRELGFDDESLPSLWSLGPDVVVQAGTTSKTFFPGVRLGWAAGAGRGRRPARRGEADHRPVRRRARPAALRGVRAARLDRRAARALAGALRRKCERHARRARARDAGGRALDDAARRLLLVADAPGRSTLPSSPRGRSSRESASSPARSSSRTAAATTASASPSAWSTRRRSTTGIARLAAIV